MNPTRRNKNIYNRLSKNVSRKIKEIKSEYERNRFRNKKVTGIRNKSDIADLCVNGIVFQVDYQKDLVLADQFRSAYNVCNNAMSDCGQSMPPNSFSNILVSDEDILKALREMNANSAC